MHTHIDYNLILLLIAAAICGVFQGIKLVTSLLRAMPWSMPYTSTAPLIAPTRYDDGKRQSGPSIITILILCSIIYFFKVYTQEQKSNRLKPMEDKSTGILPPVSPIGEHRHDLQIQQVNETLPQASDYIQQVGAFSSIENAKKLQDQLQHEGYRVVVLLMADSLYHVRIKPRIDSLNHRRLNGRKLLREA